MNYFDPGENSNKVWIGMAYSDGKFETRFGRVRDEATLVSKEKKFATQADAENELERKRREKLRKGYKDTVVGTDLVGAARILVTPLPGRAGVSLDYEVLNPAAPGPVRGGRGGRRPHIAQPARAAVDDARGRRPVVDRRRRRRARRVGRDAGE